MSIVLISYSRTGNNRRLAESLAKKLKAQHIPLTKPKSKSGLSLFIDYAFDRQPRVEPKPSKVFQHVGQNDMILLIGPVWLGKAASPLRPFLEKLKKLPNKYGFVSLSGGANGPNPNLEKELTERVGRKPDILINKFLADLMNLPTKPTVDDTMKYQATADDIAKVTKEIIVDLKKIY